MSSISSVSSSGFSLQGISKASSAKGNRQHDRQVEFEQDLAQAGLNANVTPDALLDSIQSSIKSAIQDPKNDGKDFLQVVQEAVQETLKENGVDTEKLTSLLQSQYGQAGPFPPLQDPLLDPNAADGERPKPPQQFLPRIGSDPNQNDDDADDEYSSSKLQKVSTASSENLGATNANIPDEVASEFKRLLAHLIQSLPSGTALDVQA